MTQRAVLIALRLLFGLLALTALGSQFAVQVQAGFSVLNFCSYFTNLANLFAAGVLLVGAFSLLTRREPSVAEDLLRGAAAMNMAVVGIVFSVLLRNVDLGHLRPWINIALHYVMPVAVALEWLIQPPRTKLTLRQMLLWQAFPLLYLIYTLVRGALVGWYPYPFLNPATAGGCAGVAAYVAGILAVFLLVGGAALTLGNRLNEKVAAAK